MVWYHAPAWESDSHGLEIDQRFWEERYFIPKFEQYDVDLVLWGHGKIYERIEHNGITYSQVCSGAGMRDFIMMAQDSQFRYRDLRTVLFVDADPAAGELRWTAVKEDGTTLETGTVR